MMTVRKSSVFPAPEQEIYRKLQKLKTLQYIAYPFATFEPVNGDDKLVWRAGTVSSFKFKLFRWIPFGVHAIRVIRFGLEEGILTNETNKYVPVWNHEITLEKLDENTTRYTDIVEIDAGWRTVFVYLWAVCFYMYRQKKWIKLLNKEIGVKDGT